MKRFDVAFLEDAEAFLSGLDEKAKYKVLYNIRKAQEKNDPELFKKLTDDIWEFRTFFNKTHYRLFAFWDRTDTKATLVIVTHGLIKKTAKTPKGDLEKAERLMKQYIIEKKNNDEKESAENI
ncbi:MAG: type II toxin-antitoxin system RelE/ParE family toxin [Chitinophagales bacterium]